MKHILSNTILFSLLLIFGCSQSKIDGDLVEIDTLSSPAVYTLKDNGERISGVVIFNALDPQTGNKYKQRLRELKEGLRINIGYNFYPNGQISEVYHYSKGMANGIVKTYYENGSLYSEVPFINDKADGVEKTFDETGNLVREAIFKNGEITEEFEIDENEKRIVKTDVLPLKQATERPFKKGYQFSLNDDKYYPIDYLRYFSNSDSLYITTYKIYNPVSEKHVYTITATHDKYAKHVVVDVSDTKGSIFSNINTEEINYEVPTLEPFGFRGNIGLLGGQSVPNQLMLKFVNAKFENVEVQHINATAAGTNNFLFYVLDGK